MTFHLITLFPEAFSSIFSSSIIKRAQEDKKIKINYINPRDFALDKYKTVDDRPYGGGAGMVMRVDTIIAALESIHPKPARNATHSVAGGPYAVLTSASGKTYNQKMARKLSTKKNLAIICGHYEGVDARVEKYVDEIISIGDYVLTGGEIAAAAIVDSVARLVPGVINPKSLATESFSKTTPYNPQPTTYLEYPQYTRPENFRGAKAPKVLLSGDHKKISDWRQKHSKKKIS